MSTAQCRHDGNQVFRVDLLPTMVRVGILHQILIYLGVLSIVTFLAIGRPWVPLLKSLKVCENRGARRDKVLNRAAGLACRTLENLALHPRSSFRPITQRAASFPSSFHPPTYALPLTPFSPFFAHTSASHLSLPEFFPLCLFPFPHPHTFQLFVPPYRSVFSPNIILPSLARLILVSLLPLAKKTVWIKGRESFPRRKRPQALIAAKAIL